MFSLDPSSCAPSSRDTLRRLAAFSEALLSSGALLLACTACSAPDEQGQADATGSGDEGGGDISLPSAPDTEEPREGADETPTLTIFDALPEGFVSGTSQGGLKTLGRIEELEQLESDTCGNVLRGIVRDFTQEHSDFKPVGNQGLFLGMVESTLGASRKPVYADPPVEGDVEPLVSSADTFSEWYLNLPEVNLPFVVDFWLEPSGDTFVFDTEAYFPLDHLGFHTGEWVNADYATYDQLPHAFLFTTELHTSFQYQGGEVFTFRGDDDVWVFVNGKLAIDLGGVHGPEEGSVELDERAATLGLKIGEVYELDLFQAERNPNGSNFRMETSLNFTNCGQILESDRAVR